MRQGGVRTNRIRVKIASGNGTPHATLVGTAPRRRPVRADRPRVVTAVAAPAAATGLASLIWSNRPAGATSVFLLAVLAAAVAGGMWSGVIAAVLSFLSLNFFFIPPKHTLAVRHPADLAALLVFLLVAVGAGLLVGRVVVERDRARRRAAESEHLRAFTSSLASGRPLGDVLPGLATDLETLLGLESCEIVLELPDGTVATATAPAGEADVTLPIGPDDAPFGHLTARRPRGEPQLTSGEQALLGAFRDQLELAAGRVRTEAEARRARLDADASSLRAALFSAVTHDLRTPLASITASVTGLLDSWDAMDAGQRRELLETIDEESRRLNRLVGNLLDLARMRAGALAPSPELAGVDEIVQAVSPASGRCWSRSGFER